MGLSMVDFMTGRILAVGLLDTQRSGGGYDGAASEKDLEKVAGIFSGGIV